ncbi:MAG: hypothetical protein CTY13_01160 [Methylobacter sp.]|nr:MAG: hypothetical protein CTY13_01160 [Methylobacter sp.]
MTKILDEDMLKTATETATLGYLIKPREVSRIVPAIEVGLLRADQQIKTTEKLNSAVKNNPRVDISTGLIMDPYQLNWASAFERYCGVTFVRMQS